MRDTIFALATGPARAAIAVMRVSGPRAKTILERLVTRAPKARVASVRRLNDIDGQEIDQALVLWFPAPHSFTGEDVFELHLHGGPAIIAATASVLSTLGARLAEPGEFTRRAFEAGRLELSQAEAIADLIDAETEAQRKQAVAQLGGALAKRGEIWRDILLNAAAVLEAQIDFPDEDVPSDVGDAARAPLQSLLTEIDALLADDRGARIRSGLRIALIGAPNAGKSSLMNALTGRDASIVTSIPGATRDVIESQLVIEGYKVTLADMAGLRDATDEIEIEGVRRAKAWAGEADLRLWLWDCTSTSASAQEPLIRPLLKQGDVLVMTKVDLEERGCETPKSAKGLKDLRCSVVLPAGIDDLKNHLKTWVIARMAGAEAPALTRTRHFALLRQAKDHLERALDTGRSDAELTAENVRLTARSLEQLSGHVGAEDILDRLFGSFCIGK